MGRFFLPMLCITLILGIVSLTGCQASSDAEVSTPNSAATGSGTAPGSPPPADPPSGVKARLTGSWDGAFQLHPDAPLDQFDETTINICKSIRMMVVFHENERIEMSAVMTLPELGQQTTETSGNWDVVSANGDEVQLRWYDEDGDGEGEDATVIFLDDSSFTMTPPNELRDLGVLKFTKN